MNKSDSQWNSKWIKNLGTREIKLNMNEERQSILGSPFLFFLL